MLTSSADEEGCDIFSKECLIIDRKTIKKEKEKRKRKKKTKFSKEAEHAAILCSPPADALSKTHWESVTLK